MSKNSVTKFDLEAAFKALDEINYAESDKGLVARRRNLAESMRSSRGQLVTETLLEDYYDLEDNDALDQAARDQEAEVAQAKLARIEKIVDLDAKTADDLLPSYVGKVIIQCPQCMNLFYKNEEDIEKDEEDPTTCNVNEPCQHCGNISGYTLIGKVDKVADDEMADFTGEAEEEPDALDLDLDFDEKEPEAEEETPADESDGEVEEAEETPEEEETNEDLDLDLNLESLNNSKFQKKCSDKTDLDTDNHSKNLSLNESACELTEDTKVARVAQLTTGDSDRVYDGFVDGTNWNGFESPCFTKEVADQIAADYNEMAIDSTLKYDTASDSYILSYDDNELEPEIFDGSDTTTEAGETIHTYPIGAWSWTWNLAEGKCEGQECEESINKSAIQATCSEKTDLDTKYHSKNLSLNEAKKDDADYYEGFLKDACYYINTEGYFDISGSNLAKKANDIIAKFDSEIKGKKYGKAAKAGKTSADLEVVDLANGEKRIQIKGIKIEEACAAKTSVTKGLHEDVATALKAFEDSLDVDTNESIHNPEINKSGISKNAPEQKSLNEAEETEPKELDKADVEDMFDDAQVAAATNMAISELDTIEKKYTDEVLASINKDGANTESEVTEESLAESSATSALKAFEASLDEAKTPAKTDAEKQKKLSAVQSTLAEFEVALDAEYDWTPEQLAKAVKDLKAKLELDLREAKTPAKTVNDITSADIKNMLNSKSFSECNEAVAITIGVDEVADDVVASAPCDTMVVSEPETTAIYDGVEQDVVAPEVEAEIADNVAATILDDKTTEEKAPVEEEQFDDITKTMTDLADEPLTECIQKALTEVYENVKSFELTGCEVTTHNRLVIEGLITFNSGRTKTTSYIFTEGKMSKRTNKVILKGLNEMFGKNSKFVLTGQVTKAGELITEGFSYKYKVDNTLVEGLTKSK